MTFPALRHPRRSWPFALLLAFAAVFHCSVSLAEPVTVRHPEGTVHGFLALRTLEGKLIATGDLTQVVRGDRLIARLTFRFKDGSIDDETTVFTQNGSFKMISNHHVQKGPSFKDPVDLSIDSATGEVTVRSTDHGKEKVTTDHLDLPPDLVNGLILDLVKNISPDTPETKVSMVAATPKPRLVKLAFIPQGEEPFSIAGTRHKAMKYRVKVEIGGIAGAIAPIIGKQPEDTHIWVLGGVAPAFVKSEGPLSLGGPVWRIELTSPVWPRSAHPAH